MLEFLETNYVWLIVVGVILLMTIIGYFAEKYDNTKKPVTPKKEKDIEPEKEEVEEDEVPEVYNQENSLDNWDTLPEIEEDVDQLNFEDNDQEEVSNENSFDDYEVKEPIVSEEVKNDETSYEEPFNDTETIEPVIENNYEVEENNETEESKNEDLEITLPSIESLDEEIKDVVEEDDVWKF